MFKSTSISFTHITLRITSTQVPKELKDQNKIREADQCSLVGASYLMRNVVDAEDDLVFDAVKEIVRTSLVNEQKVAEAKAVKAEDVAKGGKVMSVTVQLNSHVGAVNSAAMFQGAQPKQKRARKRKRMAERMAMRSKKVNITEVLRKKKRVQADEQEKKEQEKKAKKRKRRKQSSEKSKSQKKKKVMKLPKKVVKPSKKVIQQPSKKDLKEQRRKKRLKESKIFHKQLWKMSGQNRKSLVKLIEDVEVEI